MPSAETEATVVEVETRIAAAPETVFDFFIDPDKMIQWMGRAAELEPRPGGGFRCEMNDRYTARGEYVVVEPSRRVVFTWGWEGEGSETTPGSSTVEVELEDDGDGGTRVRLVHRDLPSAEATQGHRKGWEHYLARLRLSAAGEDPGPDDFGESQD